MKKFDIGLLKVIKWIVIVLISAIALFFIVRFVGQKINTRTPKDGINESMYVDINGTKQWISIYGEDINNPVLLYLHGGPGSSTSSYDYAFTRKWADIYTVVTWDQRNCGKSYSEEQNNTTITYDLMMTDGAEMTEFILDYLGKDKITLLGHSWGSLFGANLALEYPQYYDCFIGTGQSINFHDNEVAFKEVATTWVRDDEEGKKLINRLTIDDFSADYFEARNILMNRYGYDMFTDGTDYNIVAAQIFNPYYSITNFISFMNSDYSIYMMFVNGDEFKKFWLSDRNEYQMPYYNINGDKDYQTNYILAQEYYDMVKAPYKKMYIMKDTTHGLLESKSGEFSDILHEIAELKKQRGNH